VLYRAVGGAKTGEPVETALAAARLPEDDAVDGTVGSFRPSSLLDPADGWDYILEVRSVDAAGNQSTVLSIPKLVIPSLDALKPVLQANDGSTDMVPLVPNDQGVLVTASATPAWTWTGTGKETKFRYQLREGGFTTLLDGTRWVETGITEADRSFQAGTDAPRQNAAPAALGQGSWTLYVQAYFVALGGWANAGYLTIEVTGNPPPDPAFASAVATRTNDTTPTWTWDLAAGTTTAERELVSGYQWELAANPRTPDDPEMVLSGVINPADVGSVFTFTPAFVLADGNASLRVWTLDSRGVRSRQSASLLVIVDTVAPRLFAVNSLVGSLGTAIKAGDPAFPDEEPLLLAIDASFELVFSKAMDAGTVAAAVTLQQDGSASPLDFAISSATNGLRHTIVPAANLAQGSSFSIAIAASAADLAGNILDTEASRTFDTGILASSVSSAVVPDANLRGALARSATAYALANGGIAAGVYMHQLLIVENDSEGDVDWAVKNLEGLQYCSSVHTLNLFHNNSGANRVESLTGQNLLASLPRLQTLVLEGYFAVDTGNLPESLTNLSLAGSSTSNNAGLPDLTALQFLDLRNGSLGTLSPLAGLTALRYLNVAKTGQSGDLNQLQNLLQLEHLDITGNTLTSLSGLNASMTSLKSISAKGNSLDAFGSTVLNVLASLEYLYLCENRYTSLPNMGSMTSLKVARFADQGAGPMGVVTLNGRFDDQDPDASGSFLDLSGNGITSLTIGPPTFRGEVLDLSGNALTGTAWASQALFLRELDLSGNSGLGADTNLYANLSQIPGITFLDLTGCGVAPAVITQLQTRWPAATIVSP
jgi:Leucine-rich repeat (LRR) protein